MSRAERKAALLAQALLVYVEPFVQGKRALFIGDASLGVGERLVELGARSVHVFDQDAARIPAPPTSDGGASSPRGVVARPLPDGEFDFRDGAFDCAVVLDPETLSDTSSVLARVRRVLGRGGCIFLSAANTEITGSRGFTYTELFDLVALQFENVAVMGRVPWSGVAFARLGVDADAVSVTVDTQLVGEQPHVEAYVLVGSQEDHELDSYVIVQLPDDGHARRGTDIAAFAEVQLKAEMLSAQLEEQRTLSARGAHLVQAKGEATSGPDLEGVVTRAEQAEARVKQEFARAERLVENTRELDKVVETGKKEIDRLQKEAETERRARKKLEIEVALLQERVENKDVPGGPTIRVLSPKRGFDVESTVALRDDQLANLKDELAGSFPSAVTPGEGVEAAPGSKPPQIPQLLARANAAAARADRAELLAEEADARAEAAEARAADAERAALAAKTQAAEVEAKVKREKVEHERVDGALEDLARAAQDAEGRAAAAETRAAASEGRAARYEGELATVVEAVGRELQALEAQLRDRGRHVADLEDELKRRERMIHDLIDGMPEGAAPTEAMPVLPQAAAEARRQSSGAPVVPPPPALPRPSPSGVTLTASGIPPAARPAIDPAAYHALEASFLKAQSIVELQAQEIDLLTQERIESKEKLRVLGIELARYQGEVFARDWRITELEQRLTLAMGSGSAGGGTSGTVEASRREDRGA